MYVRLMGQFQVKDAFGQDRTPRGAKARALLALLCRTDDQSRPRRWLEQRLWSDRGPEQASGSLRQALTELRKSLGPLADQLNSDRDSVTLTGCATDLDQDPEASRLALAEGREFLEGIDIVDAAFNAWLQEERVRVAQMLDRRDVLPARDGSRAFALRLASLPDGTGTEIARDLAQAIARMTAEYLLRAGPAAEGGRDLPEGLDLHVEGAWSGDRAHLKLRLVAQADQKPIWSHRLIASRKAEDGQSPSAALEFETSDAPIM